MDASVDLLPCYKWIDTTVDEGLTKQVDAVKKIVH